MGSEQDRIAQLERQNAYLISALANSNGNFNDASHHGFDYSGNAPQASNNLVRSQSNTGYGSGNVMMDQRNSQPQAVKRARAYSQQASSANPFRPNGPTAPLASAPMGRSQSSRSQSRGDVQRSPSGLSPQPLQSIREQEGPSVGLDPSDFLATRPHESSYLAMTSTNLSPTTLTQHHQGPSITPPSLVSGSSALEDSPDMSRQHSSFGHWPTTTPMINSASQQSFFGEAAWGDSPSFTMPESDDPKSYASSQDFVGFGGAFPGHDSFDNNMFLPLPESVPMDRSASNTSTSSNRSTASNLEKRARERHEQVIRNSTTVIQPKPQEPGEKVTANKKMPVSKPVSTRRKQNKVTCPHCKDHPEFRGEHERNRHIAAKHSKEVTKFICRDPALFGLESSVQPKVPLKGCKACDSGKHYGAYYNAAAHLRRWHFNPKDGRGKGKKTAEKRGGSAGGYWPEMDDLKVWFEKKTVIEGLPIRKSEDEDADEEMSGLEDNVEDATVEEDLTTFLDTNNGFTMPNHQAMQVSPMVPDLSQPTTFQPAGDDLFDSFVGYPEATYADSASPFFGSGSSAAFTPASNYELWGQGPMGNAFPGTD